MVTKFEGISFIMTQFGTLGLWDKITYRTVFEHFLVNYKVNAIFYLNQIIMAHAYGSSHKIWILTLVWSTQAYIL